MSLSESRMFSIGDILTPNYSEEYYPRKCSLLQADEGAYHFFAKRTDNATCEIVVITNDPCLEKDWVWNIKKQDYSTVEKLVIPSKIEGCSVIRICKGSTDSLTENIKEIHIEEGIKEIGENCFCQLPFITDIYLPESIEQIGEGAFGYFEKSQYLKIVPTLYVHYNDALPVIMENAFVRIAIREDYEDYADWGEMYVGSTNIDYEVVYQRNEQL